MDQKDNIVYIPVSYGELFDKISILNIKQTQIKDKSKLSNIKKEQKLLEELDAFKKNLDKVLNQYIELTQINQLLWNIEDDLRYKESKQSYKEFDDHFIDLARQVYKLNDRRSELKKQINILLNSNIVEEKLYEKY